MEPLTDYEAEQVQRIAEWKGRRTIGLVRFYDAITKPLVALTAKAIPENVATKLVDRVYRTCDWKEGRDFILSIAGVRKVSDLRQGTLDTLRSPDPEAGSHRSRARVHGVRSRRRGSATELFDIPIEIVMSLKTIRRIAACYGYVLDRPEDQTLVLLTLGLSVAEEPEERLQAEEHIRIIEKGMPATEDRDNALREIENEVIEDIGRTVLENKLEELIPVLGSIVGVMLDNAFIHGVERAAQCVFQERWLRDRNKVDVIAPIQLPFSSCRAIGRRVLAACYATGYARSASASRSRQFWWPRPERRLSPRRCWPR